MERRQPIFVFVLLGVPLLAPVAGAQKYKLEDLIPPGAQGKVLPLQGRVLEIRGIASGMAGKIDALGAALQDLGAKATETEIRIELSADVLFDFDKADILPKAEPSLERVATVLRSYAASACTIEGHTDGKGTHAYNQPLSERRAASVKNWLAAHGATNPITTSGFAATKPVAPNKHPGGRDNPDGRQKNRRVEIVVKKR